MVPRIHLIVFILSVEPIEIYDENIDDVKEMKLSSFCFEENVLVADYRDYRVGTHTNARTHHFSFIEKAIKKRFCVFCF